ncbi:hypothetical protein S7711_05865 [Stachybotrys chartarum IBT 7711]|uniref:NADH:ubiquinone oxidoreductase intermediate-associated protein 30 domain-containing protein n=1 Tax=Stachybotrys chartarum (strain CBS 109288 / IBT 7711) TaxID=1280523 RepID=A0A084AKN0_STACB|nr:hypothetical protein S7711_05865 [Stachybotrys chartarum IBT 7711]KFA75339.1 hypothetical protein S40288_01994 [Stachybotrys chartarum IBT 40288]
MDPTRYRYGLRTSRSRHLTITDDPASQLSVDVSLQTPFPVLTGIIRLVPECAEFSPEPIGSTAPPPPPTDSSIPTMRAAQPLFAKSFFSRSVDELKRRSSIAWNLEAIKGATTPRPLYDFTSQDAVRECIVMGDTLIGGSSKSNFDFIPPAAQTTSSPPSKSALPTSYARFHGSISTKLPENLPKVKRSGYAGFRTPDQPPTIFGDSIWDIDPYVYLALRIKSDGRSYFINVQTEGIEPSDLHQHRLFAQRPGQWETILVRWNDFVRTNYGFVIEPQTELLRHKVKSVGIGLTDRLEGPFELCIERVWATNDINEGDAVLKDGESGLKNKKGQSIQW